MWSITHVPTTRPTDLVCTAYKLLVGETYIVGRKDCSIVLATDQSISRKHATIYIDEEMGRPGAPPVGVIKDTSKYGTAVNDMKVDGNGRPLREGDVIRFGMLGVNDWRMTYTPLVAVMSSIEGAEKDRVTRLVRKLGGIVVNDWRKDCTHLVMTEIRITIKVVCCLASECPIVTPAYLEAMVIATQNQQPFPNPAHYRPPLAEVTLNENEVSFAPDPKRRTLFTGTKFVCFSQKQFKKIHLAIHLAGGETLWVGDGAVNSSMLVAPNICVMQLTELDCQGAIPDVPNVPAFLKMHSRRMIPESEIGLSLLFCSTRKYCNPGFDVGAALLFMTPPVAQSLSQPPQMLASDSEQTQPRYSEATQPRTTSYYSQSQSLVAEETPMSDYSQPTQPARSVIQSTSNGTGLKRPSGFDDGPGSYGSMGSNSPPRKQFRNDGMGMNSGHGGMDSMHQPEQDLFTWDGKPTLQNLKRPAESYHDGYRDTSEPSAKMPRTSEDLLTTTSEQSSTNNSGGYKLSRLNPETGLIEEYSPEPYDPDGSGDTKFGIHMLPGGWISAKPNRTSSSNNTTVEPMTEVKKEEVAESDDLPSRLIVTVPADLVVNTPRPQPEIQCTKKNFKKFRKVGSETRRIGGIPLIIGGTDLVVRTRVEEGYMNHDLTDSPAMQDGANNINGDERMFEWAPSPPRRNIITIPRR